MMFYNCILADRMVSGASNTTANTISTGLKFIKTSTQYGFFML